MKVGRCLLQGEAWVGLVSRYAEHLAGSGAGPRTAGAALLAAGLPGRALDWVRAGGRDTTATQLLERLQQAGQEVEPHQAGPVWADAARLMAELGLMQACQYYCDKLGEEGPELWRELSPAPA